MKIGVYPGSFDPFTNGHLDIIKRAYLLFDRLYVVVPINPNKSYLFDIDERIKMIKESLKDFPNVIVDKTDLLTVDYAKSVGAKVLVRGLRTASDFVYETQLALVNETLYPDIETIFLMSSSSVSCISSTAVKEIVKFGGDVSNLVPSNVKVELDKKFKK